MQPNTYSPLYTNEVSSADFDRSREFNSHMTLVGSRLSNSDEIINTPQNTFIWIAREGWPWTEDFLPAMEG